MLRTFRSRWARALAALLPIALATSSLWLLERLRRPEAVHTVLSGEAATERLFVVLVDSLAERDVAAAAMPRLAARLEREGLHGPVRPCADAVTVPCVLAMVKGSDHLSVFALERNFAGRESAVHGSVLGELAGRGLRLGYFGEPQLARALRGLHVLDTRQQSDEARLKWAREQSGAARLALTIVHLLELDDTSHLRGADSRHYAAALTVLDRSLDRLLDSLATNEHAVVLGDHGHTQDGRHAAGLEATTYAAYFGARFRAPRRVAMAMTDHASLWARLFGLRRSDEPSWVRALFAAQSARAPPSSALSVGESLPALRSDVGPPLWYALLLVVASIPVAFGAADLIALRRLRLSAVLGGLLLLAAALAFILGWPALRTSAVATSALLFISSCALGELLRSYPMQSSSALQRALLGALVFAPPLLRLAGGPRFALLVVMLGASLALVRSWRAGQRGADTYLTGAALPLLASLLPGAMVALPERFFVYTHGAALLGLALPLALLLVAVALAAADEQRRHALLASALGSALALAWPLLPARLALVPCAVALPLALLALRRRSLFVSACLLAPSALLIFFERDPARLSPLLALLLLAALFARALPRLEPLTRAALLVLLLWLSYWTTLGTRLGGVDFDFYFAFMPSASSATREWPLTALLTAAKYLFASALTLLFASQRAPLPIFTFDVAAALARLRLGFLLVLTAFACATRMIPSSWLLGELMQETALFILLLLTLGALGASLPQTAPALATDRC